MDDEMVLKMAEMSVFQMAWKKVDELARKTVAKLAAWLVALRGAEKVVSSVEQWGVSLVG